MVELLPEVAELPILALLVLAVLTLRAIPQQVADQRLQGHLPALVPLLQDCDFILQ
jgi:hypothetical protein